MKHLLNNLSEEEKNSIREQHTDKLNIDTSKFARLMESKLGDVKPLLSEQPNPQLGVVPDELKKLLNVDDKTKNLPTKRPYDKMVIDCLIKDGFKKKDVGGKYDVFLEKPKNSNLSLVVTSQEDPTKFGMSLINSGAGGHKASVGYGQIIIGKTTNCQDIVKFANKPERMMGAI